MTSRRLAPAILVMTLLAAASCRRENGATAGQTGSSASATSAIAPPPNAGAFRANSAAELDSAARQVIGFLRGEVGFDRIRLADTVTLHVSPEGGGTRAAMPRETLRDRSNWKVPGQGRATYSLTPPATVSKLTTRPGRHINCREYELSSRVAELGQLPHVGTKLEPANASSCLQTWNLTLVFDPNVRPPTLVAAVYDQWEW